tara:strand:+ start:7250 stop:7888 length:639 start_codon:yes stop_codon:yes gene_type:complete
MQAGQSTTFLIIVAAIVIVLALIWFVLRRRTTTRLRDRYGEEYDRTVERVGGRGKAERNLAEREQRVSQLHLRPLSAAERERFTGEWQGAKTLFVDSPQEAVLRADRLLGTMMAQRGFPVEDFDRRHEDLTVHHAEVANDYRQGHEIADKGADATTEEMRRALNHYEKLFEELVSDAGDGVRLEELPGLETDDGARESTVLYDSADRRLPPG